MKLKEARMSTGLGRHRASKCIGMGVPQLYRYEAGLLRPGIEVVMRISQALELNPWSVDEFQAALEQAEALGLVASADKNGNKELQE
jgi:transcriptional regulator with XRE-family HTH domain